MLSVTRTDDEVVTVRAAGSLTSEDYQRFTSELESLAARGGNMRLLIRLADFEGWESGAARDHHPELRLHLPDAFPRVAVVGQLRHECWMIRLSEPFSHAYVRYFEEADAPEAWSWLAEAR